MEVIIWTASAVGFIFLELAVGAVIGKHLKGRNVALVLRDVERRKPIVKAVQVTSINIDQVAKWCTGNVRIDGRSIEMMNEGDIAFVSDFIVEEAGVFSLWPLDLFNEVFIDC